MRRVLVAGCLWGLGCAPKVHLTVLEAADITLPADLRTVAVLDRSRPEGTGAHVLGALEGLATGEGLAVDRGGASAAIDGVARLLGESPRFEVVHAAVGVGSGPDPLTPEAVEEVLGVTQADALLALEAFDSDSILSVTSEQVAEMVEGEEVSRTEFTADRGTKVEATWRLYDARGRVLDVLLGAGTTDSWQAKGPTRALAEGALPPLRDVVAELGGSTGTAYGRRISPWYADVVRDYFVRGDPGLRAARHAVRAGDWKTAIAVWSELARTGDPRVRARAQYDLAVAYEVKGQYRRALSHAEDAARLVPSARILRYRDRLKAWIPERRALQEQMRPVGGVMSTPFEGGVP